MFTFNPLEAAQTINRRISPKPASGDTSHSGMAYQARFAAGLTLFAITYCSTWPGPWLRRRYHRSY
jgi:ABC-type phosphate transport system permease subunit